METNTREDSSHNANANPDSSNVDAMLEADKGHKEEHGNEEDSDSDDADGDDDGDDEPGILRTARPVRSVLNRYTAKERKLADKIEKSFTSRVSLCPSQVRHLRVARLECIVISHRFPYTS